MLRFYNQTPGSCGPLSLDFAAPFSPGVVAPPSSALILPYCVANLCDLL